MNCPFCGAEDEVLGNELAYAKFDAYPVSPGHLLIIPRRHAAVWFDLDSAEQQAILNGSQGETMAKVMKTQVMFGEAFGA